MKKRTKKLLSVSDVSELPRVRPQFGSTDKSFLLLFFKKEGLSSLPSYQRPCFPRAERSFRGRRPASLRRLKRVARALSDIGPDLHYLLRGHYTEVGHAFFDQRTTMHRRHERVPIECQARFPQIRPGRADRYQVAPMAGRAGNVIGAADGNIYRVDFQCGIVNCAPGSSQAQTKKTKFFGSFFQKRTGRTKTSF